jgi:ribosomal protein L40E
VAETIRCPHCGGLNPSDAQWCGQCLTRFAAPEPEPEPEPEPHAPAAVATSTSPGGPGAVPATDRAADDGRAFTVTADGITWTCPTCETPNPIDSDVCSVCGTTFSQMVHPEPEMVDKDPNTAALISLFFPGAGHGYLGLWGDAIARGVISLWVAAVAFIAAFAGEQASGRLVTILFGFVAFGLWGVASHDAYRAARKERERVILKGRGFLFLVLGLLGLLLLIVVGSALRARG